MTKEETTYSLKKYKSALDRLAEAVQAASDNDELKRDGAIQRFEFTFELLWKALKIYLESTGRICSSPRAALKEAFKQGFFEDEPTFLEMLEDRNLSSHVYDADEAAAIFSRIKSDHLQAMQKLSKVLEAKISEL